MSDWLNLQIGEEVIGFVRIVGGENFYIRGRFRTGPAYSNYGDLLEKSFYHVETKEWLGILEEIDKLGLRLLTHIPHP